MDTDRLRVRIDAASKTRAMERAEAQGVTLSGAIRVLLDLWCDGFIDLRELQALPDLPSKGELAALGQPLADLERAIAAARDTLGTFSRRHGQALDLSEALGRRPAWW